VAEWWRRRSARTSSTVTSTARTTAGAQLASSATHWPSARDDSTTVVAQAVPLAAITGPASRSGTPAPAGDPGGRRAGRRHPVRAGEQRGGAERPLGEQPAAGPLDHAVDPGVQSPVTGAGVRAPDVPMPPAQQRTADAGDGSDRDGQHRVGVGGRRPQPQHDQRCRAGEHETEQHAALQRQDDGSRGEHEGRRPVADAVEQDAHHARAAVASGTDTATSGGGERDASTFSPGGLLPRRRGGWSLRARRCPWG
jgi:hypothetical protein